jgi:hypothetical protein
VLPLAEIQAAVYAALVPALAPVPVLDLAGPDQEYPYVTLGEFSAQEFDTLDCEAVDMDMTVHCWSRRPGMREVQQMMQRAKDALHRKSFPLTGGIQHVTTIWEFAQTLRDADGVTRHGVLRFRILTFLPVSV